MGGVDPTIALRAGGIGAIGAQNQLNPFEAMSNLVNMQRGLNEIRSQNAQFFGLKLAGEIASQYPNLEQGARAILADPMAGPFGGEYAERLANINKSLTDAGLIKAQTGETEQRVATNSLNQFVLGLGDLNDALLPGKNTTDDQIKGIINGGFARVLATTPDDMKGRATQASTAVTASLFAGTDGLSGQERLDKIRSNYMNMVVSTNMGPAIEAANGPIFEQRVGNEIVTSRATPGGSSVVISRRPMGAPPQWGTTVTGEPTAVPAIQGGPDTPGVAQGTTTYPGLQPGQGPVIGPGLNVTGEQAMAGAGTGGPAFQPQAMPPPGTGGPQPVPTTPQTRPGGPQAGTSPTATGAPATGTADKATPYQVGPGGTFQNGTPLPAEGKAINYAPDLMRESTTIPDGTAANAPVAGDGRLLFNNPQDLVSNQRIYGKQEADNDGTLQANLKEANAPNGSINDAKRSMTLMGNMKEELSVIAQDPKTSQFFTQIGPWSEDRAKLAQIDTLVRNFIGQNPDISTQSREALEGYAKNAQQLAFATTRLNLGQSHVAAESINRAAAANPGLENSPAGAMFLLSGNQSQIQYLLDQNEWDQRWLDQNGNLKGADHAFQYLHDPSGYTHEVFRQFGLNDDGEFPSTKQGLDTVVRMGKQGMISPSNLPGVLQRRFPGWDKQLYPQATQQP